MPSRSPASFNVVREKVEMVRLLSPMSHHLRPLMASPPPALGFLCVSLPSIYMLLFTFASSWSFVPYFGALLLPFLLQYSTVAGPTLMGLFAYSIYSYRRVNWL